MAENESWSGKFHADACLPEQSFFPLASSTPAGGGPSWSEAQAAEASGPVRCCSPGSPTPPNPLAPSSLSPSPPAAPWAPPPARQQEPTNLSCHSGLRCPF